MLNTHRCSLKKCQRVPKTNFPTKLNVTTGIFLHKPSKNMHVPKNAHWHDARNSLRAPPVDLLHLRGVGRFFTRSVLLFQDCQSVQGGKRTTTAPPYRDVPGDSRTGRHAWRHCARIYACGERKVDEGKVIKGSEKFEHSIIENSQVIHTFS